EVEGAARATAPALQPLAGGRHHGQQLAGLLEQVTSPLAGKVAAPHLWGATEGLRLRGSRNYLDRLCDLLRGHEREAHPVAGEPGADVDVGHPVERPRHR